MNVSPVMTAMLGSVATPRARPGSNLPAGLAARLRFQGDDGSTRIADDVGRTWSAAGNARLDDSNPTYGRSSLLLPDATSWVQTSDLMAAMAPGAQDFALRFWLTDVTQPITLYDSANGLFVAIEDNNMAFIYDFQTNAQYNFNGFPLSVSLLNGEPLYLCFQRAFGVMTCFMNTGWIFYMEAPDTNTYSAVPAMVNVGRGQPGSTPRPGTGKIDGFQMIVGRAVHERANLEAVPSPLAA